MKFIFAAALLAFSTGCSRSSVEVRNAADAPITDIGIRVAGNDLSIDRIGAGDSRRVSYSTRTEETITIRFQLQGTPGQCSSGTYVSPPFEDEFVVRISAAGKCSVSHRIVE